MEAFRNHIIIPLRKLFRRKTKVGDYSPLVTKEEPACPLCSTTLATGISNPWAEVSEPEPEPNFAWQQPNLMKLE